MSNTEKAMASAPNYWLAWYTAKSLALVVAVAGLAYMVGKARGAKACRR